MKRSASIMWLGTTTLAFVLGYAIGPGRPAAVQNPAGGTQSAAPAAPSTAPLAGALPPGDYSRMKLSPDQGEPTLFAAADLRKAHTELQARAKTGGQALSNP